MWAGYKTTISELVGWSDHDFTTDHTSVRLITQAALDSHSLTGLLVESGNARLGSPHILMVASSVHPTAVLGKPVVKKACRQTLWLKSDKPVESMKG